MLDEKLLNILVCPQDRGPLLLVDEAVAVTDDAEHQRLLDRAKSADTGGQIP